MVAYYNEIDPFAAEWLRNLISQGLKPGSSPMGYGVPKGMGRGKPEVRELLRSAGANRKLRLKAYGNAIVPQVGAVFIRSFLASIQELK